MTYKVNTIDHIGLVVNDFDRVKKFFEDFGFVAENEQDIEGNLLDKVMGIENAKSHVAFMASPNEQIKIELTKFINPENKNPNEPAEINTLGIQHIAMVVNDLAKIVEDMKLKNYDFITNIETHADILKVCYFKGPEGIILELAEMLDANN